VLLRRLRTMAATTAMVLTLTAAEAATSEDTGSGMATVAVY